MEKTKLSAGSRVRRILTNETIGAALIWILMLIILTIAAENFLSLRNFLNLFRFASFYMITGMGVFTVLMAGAMDMSVGSNMMLSGYVAAMIAQGSGNPVLAVIVGLIVGMAVGAFNGFLVSVLGFQSFIASMGTKMIVTGTGLVISGGYPVNQLNESFVEIGAGSFLGIYLPIYIAIVIVVITWYILTQTVLGRSMAAIGGNKQAAKISGISVKTTQWLAYVYCGACATLSGVVLTARIRAGQLNTGTGYELDCIAGTVIGAVFGTLVIATMKNGMDMLGINAYWQQIAQGLVIIIAVLLDIMRKKIH